MFELENHGSILLLRPLTPDVNDWIVEHVDPEAQWFGRALVVEPRYAADIVTALIQEGFVMSS